MFQGYQRIASRTVLMLVLLREADSEVLCPEGCLCYRWTPTILCAYTHLHQLPKGIQFWYTHLDVTHDNISVLYENELKLAGLLHLRTLKIVSSHLTALQDRVFSGVTNLTLLNLTNNALHTLNSGAFCGLESLRKLDLSKNRINSIHQDAFCALSTLQVLSLDENKLSTLEFGTFQGLTNLTVLSLRNNIIEAFSDRVFEDLHNVVFLDLTGNHIKLLDAEYLFQGMKNLLILYLIDNNLTCDCGLKDTWLWFASHNVGNIATCASPTELSGQSWVVLNHTVCSVSDPVLAVGIGSVSVYVLLAVLVLEIMLAVIMYIYHKKYPTESQSESIALHVMSGSSSEGIHNPES
ncbi:insulin-like growth factor-binding protein complex acid labile subunit isoform X2 [Zootermopsis nevadensis]|uniref:insulin-like growth factor-binding protein complex acid labile subunit isoform X2 n=1 Tax=Zootermopsis nevadensis TaxID=136037 RepID=UPI000B8EC9D3|nr:insulin-like growth factor-binding protein complex acid labile subunit isoform X2 [Zootermopsis nevadensis]